MLPRRTAYSAFDAALVLLALAGAGYVVWRAVAVLDYDWDFSFIPGYILRRGEDGGLEPNLLLSGLLTTIRLSFWATALALVVGTAMGLARTARRPFWRMIGRFYVLTVRNIPPIVLVFILYFFVAEQVMSALGVREALRHAPDWLASFMEVTMAEPARISGFFAGLATLALYEGAYIAEIVRAGIESIERGQWEAAWALGLTRAQRMRHVVGPQAFKRVVPPLAGQFISTIKDSAVVSVVSIPELTFEGLELMAATYHTFEIWITIIALYLLLTWPLSLAMRALERHLARSG